MKQIKKILSKINPEEIERGKSAIKKTARLFGTILLLSGFYTFATNIVPYYHYKAQPYNRIPRGINIQKGFVNPESLEIRLLDADRINGNETYLRIGDRIYSLKEDSMGRANLKYLAAFKLDYGGIITKWQFKK